MKIDQTKPEVGMGATMGVGSDCYPYTIVEVSKSGKRIAVQPDDAKPGENFDYYTNQNYIFTPIPQASRKIYSYRKRYDCWVEVGCSPNSCRMYIGHRRFYQDPSF